MNKIFRGEIWLCDLNPSIGHEQKGIRPALILSDDMFNQSLSGMVIVIPITSKYKGIPSHIEIDNDFLDQKSFIKSEDIRAISTHRLIKKLGVVESSVMETVEECVKMILGFA